MGTFPCFVDSIGSGTIIKGRNNAYVNDHYLTSGSVVAITLLSKGSSMAAGIPTVQAITFTSGSPVDEKSFRVWINGAAPSNINFTYAIMDVSGSIPL